MHFKRFKQQLHSSQIAKEHRSNPRIHSISKYGRSLMYFGLPARVSSFTPVKPNWRRPEFQVGLFNAPQLITPPEDIKHLWHVSLDDYLYRRQTRIKRNCRLCLKMTIKSCKHANPGRSGDVVKFSLAKSRVTYYINMSLKLYRFLNPYRMCQKIEMRYGGNIITILCEAH